MSIGIFLRLFLSMSFVCLSLLAGCGGGSQTSTDYDATATSTTEPTTAEATTEATTEAAAEATAEATPEPTTAEATDPSNPCASVSADRKQECEKVYQASQTAASEGEESPCDAVPEQHRAKCEESLREDQIKSTNRDGSTGTEETGYMYVFAKNFDPTNISKIAQFNFTELDKFSRMSKLRSGVGHDYAAWTSEYDPSGMSCRSIKHYLVPAGVPRENRLYSGTPHSFVWMSIKFFAPMDGTILNVQYTDTPDGREAQFSIQSSEYPGYYISFLHVRLLPGLVLGSSVTAGQQIGTLGNEEAWGEIVAEVHLSRDVKVLISFLQVATDEVLQLYKDRGITSAADVIITKEERDANPLACERTTEAGWFTGSSKYQADLQFMTWVFESSDNWFFFN